MSRVDGAGILSLVITRQQKTSGASNTSGRNGKETEALSRRPGRSGIKERELLRGTLGVRKKEGGRANSGAEKQGKGRKVHLLWGSCWSDGLGDFGGD